MKTFLRAVLVISVSEIEKRENYIKPRISVSFLALGGNFGAILAASEIKRRFGGVLGPVTIRKRDDRRTRDASRCGPLLSEIWAFSSVYYVYVRMVVSGKVP